MSSNESQELVIIPNATTNEIDFMYLNAFILLFRVIVDNEFRGTIAPMKHHCQKDKSIPNWN